MSTQDKKVRIYLKKFLPQQQMEENFLNYLLKQQKDTLALMYPAQGYFYGNTLAGSAPNEITAGTPALATDGLANLLDLDPTDADAKFENALGISYSVGQRYNILETDTEINVRTGQIEYVFEEDAIGEKGFPDVVINNGTTLRLEIDGVTELGVTNAGRKAIVYLKKAVSQADAFFEGTVQFIAGKNVVDTTHLLGQTAGLVSIVASDYIVFIPGPTVRRNIDLSLDPNIAFLGVVTGVGLGNTPGPGNINTSGSTVLFSGGAITPTIESIRSFLDGGGDISWNLSTQTLTWTATIDFIIASLSYNFTIVASSVAAWASGEAVYIIRDGIGGPKVLQKALIGAIANNPLYELIAYRAGNDIIFRNGCLTLQGIAGETTIGNIVSLLPKRENQDRSLKVLDEVTWNWVLGTTTLSWDASLFIRIPGLGNSVNEIAAGSAILDGDGKVAYVEVKRVAGVSILTVNTALISSLVMTNNIKIFAQRVGSNILLDPKPFALTDGGILKIKEALSVDKPVTLLDMTESTTKDTGALILEGGLGVEKNVNIGGNLIVAGDLTVNGTTTTINTTVLDVEDSNITVNKGGTQAAADLNDAGLLIEMTDAPDAQIHYDSTKASKFKAGGVGSESEVLTQDHIQTLNNKTVNALILQGDTQLKDPMRDEVATDAATTGTTATIASLPSPMIRLTHVALISIGALATPVQGKTVTLVNGTGNLIQIENNNGTIAAEGILTGTGGSISLPYNVSIILKYDDIDLRWRVIGGTGTGTGGTGVINFIENGDAEIDVAGWLGFTDAAAVDPVDGTGGTAPSITFTRNTANPLHQTGDFKWTKPASNCQGQGWSYDFTIDPGFLPAALRNLFLYKTSTNFVDGHVRIYLYNITQGRLIRVDRENLDATSLPNPYLSSWQSDAATVAENYRLIIYQSSTSALAYDIYFDNFIVGPTQSARGPVITTVTSEAAAGAVGSTSEGVYADTGVSVTLTPGVWNIIGLATLNLEGATGTGLQGRFGTVALTDSSNNIITECGGGFENADNGSDISQITVIKSNYTVTTAGVYKLRFTSFNNSAGQTITTLSTYNKSIITATKVSNQVVSEDFGTRLIAGRYRTNGAGYQLIAENTVVLLTNLATKEFDSVGAWNGSRFTAPESGTYIFETAMALENRTNLLNAYILLYKNGSYVNFSYEGQGMTPGNLDAHSKINGLPIVLNKGDYIEVMAIHNTTGGAARNFGYGYIAFHKLSGNQQIAASEIVGMLYNGTPPTGTLNASFNITKFGNKVSDTHAAYNTSTGIYTIPVSGLYNLFAHVFVSATRVAGKNCDLSIFIDGVRTYDDSLYSGGAEPYLSPKVTVLSVPLIRGQTVAVYCADDGTSPAYNAQSISNRFSISKCGGIA